MASETAVPDVSGECVSRRRSTELYRHFDVAGKLLYVGVSLSFVARLAQHREVSGWWDDIAKVTVQRFDTRAEALDAETKAIQSEEPAHNVRKKGRNKRRSALLEPITPDADVTRIEIEGAKILAPIALSPLYSESEAAALLRITPANLRREVARKRINFILLDNATQTKKRAFFTGWQILSYLELLENESA